MAGRLLIGFTGKKFSGKDTAAAAAKSLLESAGYKVITTAFADPIRDQVAKVLNCEGWRDAYNYHGPKFDINNPRARAPRIFDWEEFKKVNDLGKDSYHVSGRDLFRGVGMLMRSYDEQQFVRYVEGVFKDADADTIVLVTDVRFDNEAEMIQRLGGVIVEVTSTRQKQAELDTSWGGGYPPIPVDQHVTELGIADSFPRKSLHNPNVGAQPQTWFQLASNVNKLLQELGFTSQST